MRRPIAALLLAAVVSSLTGAGALRARNAVVRLDTTAARSRAAIGRLISPTQWRA